jgi:hypothetical protein
MAVNCIGRDACRSAEIHPLLPPDFAGCEDFSFCFVARSKAADEKSCF